MIDYNKRLVEVDEILNYLSEEELMKIPEDIRQVIKENKDKEYTWNYNEEKLLKEQNVSRDTIAILSYLNMEYLLNEQQKELMNEIHRVNEQEKMQKEYSTDNQYDYEDLFKKKEKTEEIEEIDSKKEVALIEIKKETFFRKLINKLKLFFKK